MCTSALPVFTSHYVTINSYSFPVPSALVSVFTSHYVTINSKSGFVPRGNTQ